MLENLQHHNYPRTIEEILTLLQQPNSMLLAGGTALTLERNHTVTTLVDLQKSGLSYITEEDDGFHIGAMTSAYEIFHHSSLPGALRKAADCVGDTSLLHSVTIGGNLAKFYKWVDLPPMLWALNSSVVVYNPDKTVYGADEFFAYANERNIYSRREFISEVVIPRPQERYFAEYQSFTPLKNGKGTLNLAVYFEWNEGYEITTARIVLGATVNHIIRLTAVEEELVGKNLKTAIHEIDLSSLHELKLVQNYKTSIEYRRHLLEVYLRRTLNSCKQKMEGH